MNDEDFTLEDFIEKYGDNPAIGSISLNDVMSLVATERQQWEEEQSEKPLRKIELLRQYCMGWDISPVHPMDKNTFLKRIRGW